MKNVCIKNVTVPYKGTVMCGQNGSGLKQAPINTFFSLIYKPFPQFSVPIYQLYNYDTSIEQKQRKLLTVLRGASMGLQYCIRTPTSTSQAKICSKLVNGNFIN